jgi:DNA-binding CsgD family transcriptional regulator
MRALSDGGGRPLGMQRELAQVELLLRKLPLTRDLSPRERQVVWAGARGCDTKATAAELGISPKTVDELWRRIYKKSDCRSRTEVLSRLLIVSLQRPPSVLRAPRATRAVR